MTALDAITQTGYRWLAQPRGITDARVVAVFPKRGRTA